MFFVSFDFLALRKIIIIFCITLTKLYFLGDCSIAAPQTSENVSKKAIGYYNDYLSSNKEGFYNKDAKKILKTAFYLAKQENSDSLILAISSSLRNLYSSEGKYDSAFLFGYYIIDRSKKINYTNIEAENYTWLGVMYGAQNQYDSAFFYFEKVEDIKENKKVTPKNVLINRIKKFDVLMSLGDYSEALLLLDEITNYVKINQLREYDIPILKLYYKVNKKLGNYEESISNMRKCISYYEQDSAEKTRLYFYLALSFEAMENKDSMTFYLEKSIEICKEKHFINELNILYIEVVNKECYDKERANLILNQVDTARLKGDFKYLYYFAKAKISDSISEKIVLCELIINEATDIGLKADVFYFLHEELEQIYPSQALSYYKRYKKIKDSTENIYSKVQLEKALLVNEVKKEKNNNKQNTQKQLIIICLISLVTFGFVLLYVISYKKRKLSVKEKVKITEVHKKTNNELKETLLILNNSYDFLTDSKKLLKGNIEIKDFYNKINNYVNYLNKERGIRDKLKDVQEDFFKKINNVGHITQSEKKVVLLLKLGMTSKEIANYLNITEKSVEQYRYRIRKKLKLNKEEQLQDFLNSL